MKKNGATRRRWLVPEVVQTSAMDCGPAALTCLLAGFRIPVSYGRLREACQTHVDGTSIDTMEEVAGQLGLAAEQTMLPLDHLLIAEARALPAIVVVRLPNGLTHFVVAWRRYGSFVQVMDPATGRRWLHRREFLNEVHVHEFPLTAAEWRRWAGTEEHLGALRRRQASLGLGADISERLVTTALGDPGWRRLAALDAATRMVDALERSGGLRRGLEAGRVLETLLERAQEKPADGCAVIPKAYWSVLPAPAAPSGEEQIMLRGAVLVRVLGRKDRLAPEPPPEPTAAPLSPELLAALDEPPSRPGRELVRLLTADGLLAPTALIVALAIAAAGVVAEALLFRGLFDLGRELTVTGQRLAAMSLLLLFLLGMVFLEWPLAAAMLRFGRRLEAQTS